MENQKEIKQKTIFEIFDQRQSNLSRNNLQEDFLTSQKRQIQKPRYISQTIYEESTESIYKKEGLPEEEFLSTESKENYLNNKRLEFFEKNYTDKFIEILLNQDFEYGFFSEGEKFIHELKLQNDLVFKDWISKIFIRNLRNKKLVISILNLISHLDYTLIDPTGLLLSSMVINNKDVEIKEAGIRAFEYWHEKDHLNFLQSIKIDEKWLDDYLKQVITDIEEK